MRLGGTPVGLSPLFLWDARRRSDHHGGREEEGKAAGELSITSLFAADANEQTECAPPSPLSLHPLLLGRDFTTGPPPPLLLRKLFTTGERGERGRVRKALSGTERETSRVGQPLSVSPPHLSSFCNVWPAFVPYPPCSFLQPLGPPSHCHVS